MAGDVFAGERLGPLVDDVAGVVDKLVADDAVARIWSKDHTLWAPDPTEITDRLGWLEVAGEVLADRDRLEGFADAVVADGLTHVVVMGMGGSSLFPEVMARTFPARRGRLALTVLDTTDPSAIARIEATSPLDETLFIASSKSGSTVETRSHLAHFWDKVGRPEQFAVITDPGSDLGALARERNFREIFENRPDIGGRYSALSYFGLVPAALSGVDWTGMVQTSLDLIPQLRETGGSNPGMRARRDLRRRSEGRPRQAHAGHRRSSGHVRRFGSNNSWRSRPASKAPVSSRWPTSRSVQRRCTATTACSWSSETRRHRSDSTSWPTPVIRWCNSRSTTHCRLGRQVLLWEFATAICGAVLGINAFDQPNVAEAKEATKKVLASGPPDIPVTPLDDLLGQVVEGDYLAVQAYVDPGDPVVEQLQEARIQLRDELHVATTFGLGPRFLHSTGQLHKGGPPTGVFVQVVGADDHRRADPRRVVHLRRTPARSGGRRLRDPS